MKSLLGRIALVLVLSRVAAAQDLTGTWQATAGDAKEQHRMILQIAKAEDGDLRGVLYLIDDSPDGFVLPSLTQSGGALAFELPELKLSYKGTVNSDSTSISGTITWEGEAKATFRRAAAGTAWPHDIHCACTTSFVPVAKGVKLEVLDWGGTGRPLILLAGLGNTAHIFDDFAHKLAENYHVYGITRRGFGESGSPPATDSNYKADRLGDDVVAVIDSLHLQQRPVLAGHSIAGEELSSVGSRYPEKVAALVYLDAAYDQAFYSPEHGAATLDALEIRKQLEETVLGPDPGKATSELLSQLPKFEIELRELQKQMAGLPPDPTDESDDSGPAAAIVLGQRKYTQIKVPALAIFALPVDPGSWSSYDANSRAALAKWSLEKRTASANAFEAGVPSAHVVRIPNANHFIYKSNEQDVLREMHNFLTKLPPASAPRAQSAGPSR